MNVSYFILVSFICYFNKIHLLRIYNCFFIFSQNSNFMALSWIFHKNYYDLFYSFI
jgi:hypothetical protein